MGKRPSAASGLNPALVITRSFDAPCESIVDAWLDPAQIGKWIGPRSVRAEVRQLDARIGGRYRMFMRGSDGTGPIVGGTYREIVRPERLVFTWVWETGHSMGTSGHETLITLTFGAAGVRTEMTLKHELFESNESRDSHHRGWDGSFERLGEVLAGM